jgi:hypothetical protein
MICWLERRQERGGSSIIAFDRCAKNYDPSPRYGRGINIQKILNSTG